MSTIICDVAAWEALDSRGRPTVAAHVRLQGGGAATAVVPAGASTGTHEATELRDHDERYDGQGVRTAVANVATVLREVAIGLDAVDGVAVDAALEAADGTPLLSRLGANAVLAVSIAATLAAADQLREPLYRFVATDGAGPVIPVPMVNILSGGAHAGDAIDLQDILVIPVGATSFAQAIEWASRVRASCAELARQRGAPAHLVADEGGLAVLAHTNAMAVEMVVEAIDRASLVPDDEVALAIDVAANRLMTDDGRYHLKLEARTVTAAEWIDEIDELARRCHIVSVEDIVGEDDWTGWAYASERLAGRLQLLGDDLLATNSGRLRRAIDLGIANAVLVKPNQAGTLTRARRVVGLAQRSGYATVISARSGDTEDSWLADLAVGWGCGQIKVGSTHRSERTSKWNRLLEIEHLAAIDLPFAGAAARAPLAAP